MKTAIIFIDFDNYGNFGSIRNQHPKQQHINDSVEQLFISVIKWYNIYEIQPDEIMFRFYGGWFDTWDAHKPMDREQMLRTALHNSRRIILKKRIRFEVAYSTLENSDIILTKTVQTREHSIRIPQEAMLTCEEGSNCLCIPVENWQRNGCPGCKISHKELMQKNEQKTIDTCIVADIIHASNSNSYEYIGIVSGDYDMIPGIAYSIKKGMDTTIFRIKETLEYDRFIPECHIKHGVTPKYIDTKRRPS